MQQPHNYKLVTFTFTSGNRDFIFDNSKQEQRDCIEFCQTKYAQLLDLFDEGNVTFTWFIRLLRSEEEAASHSVE